MVTRRERKSKFVKLFDKTPPGVCCPHFYELVLSNGCPYDCSYCYLRLTFRGNTQPTLFVNGWEKVKSDLRSGTIIGGKPIMKDNTDPISILAQGFVLSEFLTNFVVALASRPDRSIGDFYRDFEAKFGREYVHGQNIVFTPGAMLGLLYLMIVFPKQAIGLKNPSIKVAQLDASWGDIRIQIADKSDLTLKDLVRRMRNAISHSRVSFSSNMDFVFEDSPPRKPTDIRILMSPGDMKKFTSALAMNMNLKDSNGSDLTPKTSPGKMLDFGLKK